MLLSHVYVYIYIYIYIHVMYIYIYMHMYNINTCRPLSLIFHVLGMKNRMHSCMTIHSHWSCHKCYLPSLSFTWCLASLGWERLPPLVEGIVQEPWAGKSSKNIEDTQNIMAHHGQAFSQHLTRAESHR